MDEFIQVEFFFGLYFKKTTYKSGLVESTM